jgi:hypothetical protein
MTTLVLVNTVTIVQNSQPSKLFAGDSISDAGIQAAVQAAGGILAPATDPNIVAAQAVVQKLRSHGGNEFDATALMLAAYASSAYATATQEVEYTLTAAEIVALGAVLSGTIAFPSGALPAGARFLGAELNVETVFAGTTTLTVELGDGTTATKFMASSSLHTAGYGGAAGSATPLASIGGVTPTLTLTSTGTDLNTVTGGPATVKLFYQAGQP